MSRRALSRTEVDRLQRLGCSAGDWQSVRVSDPFDPERIRGVAFSGPVSIGRLGGQVSIDGVQRPCGLYASRIHDCTFADDVLVDSVGLLANYDIEEEVVLCDLRALVVEGQSSFANGIRINVLNEAGGRELPICDRLSAQVAWLLSMYRHDSGLQRALAGLVDRYAAGKLKRRGRVQQRSRILASGRLRNLAVGPAAVVEGALELEEGTLASSAQDPIRVGAGVVARRFIVLSGSSLDSGTVLENCFVGQGVRLGRQFSAEHCAFFANCEGFHGEAVSLFAGPYTVSHHKSTLLIAAACSFFNCGSGTNQSNHMYKLGPVHQGVLERGVKTGSFAYLSWPSRVGAFTSVAGRHTAHFDSSEFPFSNLTEKEGASLLTPAMNLLSIGTRRDADKWPARDRRRGVDKLDLIHFEAFNPCTVGAMMRGREQLLRLAAQAGREQETVHYKGLSIRRLMLKICARYYEMGISIYLGKQLSRRLEALCPRGSLEDIRRTLLPPDLGRPGPAGEPGGAAARRDRGPAAGAWHDLFGLLVPAAALEELTARIAAVADLEELLARLRGLFDGYGEAQWAWCLEQLEQRRGVGPGRLTAADLAALIREGAENALKLNSMLLSDAAKEFDERSRIGYGIDGDQELQDRDFAAVRGTPEENNFLQQLRRESKEIECRSATLLAWLEGLAGD